MSTKELIFFVNGKKVVEKSPCPEQTLVVYLRQKLHLKGTKTSCDQGACGACTVMISKYDRLNNKILHYAVTSCLVPLCSVHGLAVTTVEGVGSVNTRLHPVQEMLVKAHGTQCGFCTPGFVMSMYTLLRNEPKPSMEQVVKALRGNLCRCTGYRPILDGFKPFTKDFCPMGDQCCQRTQPENGSSDGNGDGTTIPLCDPTQEPIFPSELQMSASLDEQSLEFQSEQVLWLRPTTLTELLNIRSKYPDSRIVAGNTTIELERRSYDNHPAILVSVSAIREFQLCSKTDSTIKFGAGMCLADIESVIEELLKEATDKDCYRYNGSKVFGQMLETFAALQTKNMVTIGGCVASAWSSSDVIPLLCALQASILVCSKDKKEREIVVTPSLFLGNGKTSLQDGDVITHALIPFSKQNESYFTIKHARRDFDLPLISTAARVVFKEGTDNIQEMALYFGKLFPTVYCAEKFSEMMKDRPCDVTLTQVALSAIKEEYAVMESAGKSVSSDNKRLLEALVWQLALKIVQNRIGDQGIPSALQGSLSPLDTSVPQGTQVYEDVPENQSANNAVGRPIPHRAAKQQATGEAQFIDDIPVYDDELYLQLVTSSHAHAKVISVDASEALQIDGVVDYVSACDVPGTNKFGVLKDDETIFAEDEVTCVGYVIGGILATSREVARKAAKLVKVKYQPLEVITTIQEAIEKKSFLCDINPFGYGDTDDGFSTSDVIVEGEVELGGQEHFYMETHRALVVPLKEDQEVKVYGGYQLAMQTQKVVAEALNIPYHKVTVISRRGGGAFGGKETKLAVTLCAAVAAFKHKRAVRCVLDRETDMQIMGGRHPVLAKYKVGLSREGVVKSLVVDYYANGGNNTDATAFVVQAMLSNFDSCYRVPNAQLNGFACKTHTSSNTGFRGFGQPQTVMVTETWMTHAAEVLGITPKQIRELNMYKRTDKLPMNSSGETLTLDRCWAETIKKSDYERRREEIAAFNKANKYRKRGLAMSAIKFGQNYPFAQGNQGQALVNVYLDGSVLIHHGGFESGQGIHTKIIQVASKVLQIPVSSIHSAYNSTDITPNQTVTGGSATTNIKGFAVMDACEKLMSRLEPYKTANPEGSWKDWVNAAYLDRVNLSVSGFYKDTTPDLGYDWETKKGRAYVYYSCGVACTEVEVDILTGHHVVLRTDIVMDVGKSLNPAIDIGQIEGAFMQGYGEFALEEIRYTPDGHMKTLNALGYKIPVIANVPKVFNVSLLKDAPNPKAVYSSKAIGEPPLLLASTVPLAIREAVKAYRMDQNVSGFFRLDYPATPERVRALCPQ